MVLIRPLRAALAALNPGLPDAAYADALRQVAGVTAAQSLLAANREMYNLWRPKR